MKNLLLVVALGLAFCGAGLSEAQAGCSGNACGSVKIEWRNSGEAAGWCHMITNMGSTPVEVTYTVGVAPTATVTQRIVGGGVRAITNPFDTSQCVPIIKSDWTAKHTSGS